MSTVTAVSSTALHIIKVLTPEDKAKADMIYALIRGEDLVTVTLKDALSNICTKMPAAFKYAKDHYTLALPTGTTTQLNSPTREDVETVIAEDINYPLGVTVSYFRYDIWEPYFEVLDYLVTERAFDFTTDIISNYLTLTFTNGQQMKIVGSSISDDNESIEMSYEYWGLVTHSSRMDHAIRTWVTWEKISNHKEYIERPNPTASTEKDPCLIAVYQKLDALGEMLPEVYYWIYRIETDVYPELDNTTGSTTTDEYFPVVPIRYNNQDLTGQDLFILEAQLDELSVSIPAKQAEYDAAFAIDNGQWTVQYTTMGGTPITGNVQTSEGVYWIDYPETESSIQVCINYVPAPSWALGQELSVLQKKKATAEAGVIKAETVRDSDLYQTSKQLLKMIGVPFEELGKRINENENIAEIDHAYVIFGADIQSNDNITLAYLNYYFDYLGTLDTTIYNNTAIASLTTKYTPKFQNSSLTENGLSLSVSFKSIDTTYISGKIDKGKIGNARKTIQYTKYAAVRGSSKKENGIENIAAVPAHTDTKLILELQIAANVIRKVTVENLVVINYVSGSYVVTTTLDEIKDDPDNHNMILPLEYNLCQSLPIPLRARLYTDCCLLVVNSVVKHHLKWYEESWFSVVIVIVGFILMIVVTVASLGTLTGPYTLAYDAAIVAGATAAEAATAAAIAAAVALAYSVAIGLAISLTMQLLINEYGETFGIVGAIVTAVIAIVVYQDPSAVVKLTAQFTLSYAQLALQCSTALLSAANEFINNKSQQLIEAYTDFTDALKEATDALDTKRELSGLDERVYLDPLVFMYPKRYYTIPNESPDAFFARTLNLADNTYYGIHGAVKNFATKLLTLDKRTVTLA